MQFHILFLFAILCIFSCIGEDTPKYFISCFRFVGRPDIKFPIHLKSPYHNLLKKLNIKRTVTVGDKPNVHVLHETVHEVEKIDSGCPEALLKMSIPESTKPDQKERKLSVEIFWPGTETEIEHLKAFVPSDFDEIRKDIYGLNGLAMIPAKFMRKKTEKIDEKSQDKEKVLKSGSKEATPGLSVPIEYRFSIHYPLGDLPTVVQFSMESQLNKNSDNVYSLVIETYIDRRLKQMNSIKKFIFEVSEKKVDKITTPSGKARIYVDSTVEVVSFTWVKDNGHLANKITYFKKGNKFELRGDKSIHHWDIFDIHSELLTRAVKRKCGAFCLYAVKPLRKKCTFNQKEIIVTEFNHKRFSLYQKSRVVSAVKNPREIRVSRPASEAEIKACKNKI